MAFSGQFLPEEKKFYHFFVNKTPLYLTLFSV